MRKIALMLGTLALAACSGEAAEEEAAAPEAVVEEVAAMTTANGSPAGTYTATDADGTATSNTLNADGTYAVTGTDGAALDSGTWEVVDGKTCFTSSAEGATAMCWTEAAPGADGSFSATSDAGETVTVAPQAAAAPAEDAAAE